MSDKSTLTRDDLIDLVLMKHLRGFPPSEIALSLSIDQERVMEILASPIAKARAEDMRGQVLTHLGDLRFRFRELAPSAIERIAQLGGLTSEYAKKGSLDDSIQLRSAIAVLDRSGFPSITKLETEQTQRLAVIFTSDSGEDEVKDPEREELEKQLFEKLKESNERDSAEPKTIPIRTE